MCSVRALMFKLSIMLQWLIISNRFYFFLPRKKMVSFLLGLLRNLHFNVGFSCTPLNMACLRVDLVSSCVHLTCAVIPFFLI